MVNEEHYLYKKINDVKIPFKVKIMQSSDLDSPATFGIFRPIIFFPEDFNFSDKEFTDYILLHECGHIKYFHSLFKIISMLLVILYWYNPFVWILYFYLDRDMEIASDRFVLKQMNKDYRASYAKSLLLAASVKRKVPIFYYHYKKSYKKERIEAIMKFKRLTGGAIITSVLVASSVVSVFATTGIVLTNSKMETMDVQAIESEYENVVEMESSLLNLSWEEIEAYTSIGKERSNVYNVVNYKYVTYGKISPKTIFVTVNKNGKTYEGNISRGDYVYDSKKDKYTGYYSGKIYAQ